MLDHNINNVKIKICSRCIYDERVAEISFDDFGVCNYCRQVDKLAEQYGTGKSKGINLIERIVRNIKQDGRRKRYDCIIGVSGGTDSSYLVYLAKQWGLRPLAAHYDNTWNTAIATTNINKVLSKLEVDLYTHVVDNKESDDIFRSFFLSGVAEIEASTDLGYACMLRDVAAKYSVQYILEGHSFIEEGVTPLGRNYFDGKYIKSIHSTYGKLKMRSYPLLTFNKFLKSAIFDRIKFIRPYWYIEYSKKQAKTILEEKFDWRYYGGHHLENRMSAFYHSVYLPQKFASDMRNNTLAACVRNGNMTREQAWAEYNTPPIVEDELISYFKKRLDLSDLMYDQTMESPPKNWTHFKTYKKRFERMRPIFHLLAKADLVPMSFYLKYCFPAKAPI